MNCADLKMPSNVKHSSGDLHSRLKTRKILGVGETDNGDIHRSKISQLLGHNEHLYVKFPKGYWIWHLFMALSFTIFGFNNLFFPDKGYAVAADEDPATNVIHQLASRFYGCSSLAVAFMLWAFWGTMDKSVARSLLCAVALCHTLQIIAVVLSSWNDSWSWRFYASTSIRTIIVLTNIYFYQNISLCGLRLRKSTSFTNLRDCNSSSSNNFKKTD